MPVSVDCGVRDRSVVSGGVVTGELTGSTNGFCAGGVTVAGTGITR